MTPSQPHARSASPARRLGGLAFVAALACLVLAGVGFLAPETSWAYETLHRVSVDEMQPNQGKAWQVFFSHDEVTTSGQDHISELVVLEDGRPLDRDNILDHIRHRGAGLFSHWADRVFFAPEDNSDPRSNGRTYSFVRPKPDTEGTRAWMPRLAVLGGVLLVLGLALAPSRGRVVIAAAALTVGLVMGWDHRWAQGLASDLARAAELSQPDDEKPARAATRAGSVGNTTRLTLDPLVTEAEPFRAPPPLAIRLEQTLDEVLVMRDGEGSLRGVPEGDMHACEVAEVIVEGRLVSGSRLELRIVRTRGSGTRESTLVVPFTASPDTQVLRITHPVDLPLGCEDSIIRSLTLVSPPGSKETLAVEVSRIALVHDSARFAGRTHGELMLAVGSTARRATWQAVPGVFEPSLPEGEGLVLKGAVALLHAEDGAEATVQLTSASGELLHQARLSGDEQWIDFRVALPADGGGTSVRLGCEDLPAGAVLAWAGVRAVDTTRAPRRVLLALVDTLRADALSAFGAAGTSTPRLDALAADGVLFERCISQCYWTRPSMASLMSSRYVQATGILRFERLPDSYVTMAEVFADAGFYTVSTVSNHNASTAAGLGQGWDEMRDEPDHLVDLDAGAYCSQFLEPRLAELLDEDLLAYVHLMDPHGPYGPAEPPADWQCPPGIAQEFDSALDRPWNRTPTDTSRRELYHADVSAMDAGLGAFIERTVARWESNGDGHPVVAITSDHGEFLGEEGQWGHPYYQLQPESVHVPMLLWAPGLLPSGARVKDTVQNLDLAPTLASLAGIPADSARGWQGRDLTPAAHGSGEAGLAMSSGGMVQKLFAVYSDRGAVLGKDDALAAVLDRQDRIWGRAATRWTPHPVVASEGFNELDRLSLSRLADDYAQAWADHRDHGDDLRGALWSGVDTSQDILDPAVLQALEAMGYLER
jgi:arylsulfatase A-like enzyme